MRFAAKVLPTGFKNPFKGKRGNAGWQPRDPTKARAERWARRKMQHNSRKANQK